MTIDGNVTSLNRAVYESLQKVKNPGQMTESEAKSLRSAIMHDGRIDLAEQDLLKELTSDQAGSVKVNAKQAAGFNPSALNFSRTSGAAKTALNALAQPQDFNQLWNSGPEGMRKLIDLHSISPQNADQVKRFVATKFLQSYALSNTFNAYSPMVSTIANAYNAIKDADPATSRAGRQMYFEAMQMVDEYAKGFVPNKLYDWLKPE